jgi:hypothetical protein
MTWLGAESNRRVSHLRERAGFCGFLLGCAGFHINPSLHRPTLIKRDMNKGRLNLTIREEFKRMAAELAKKRRRSISALFEDLIETELEWEQAKQKTQRRSRRSL